MTNEEAKKIIFNQWQAFLEDNIDYAGISEAYKMAIKALEQQQNVHDTCIEDYPTCTECEHYDSEKHYCPRFCQVIKDTLAESHPYEDCISREEMLSLQTEYAEKMGATTFWELRDDIRVLPSVTPQPKKGKWIYKWMKGQFCSECDEQSVWKFNYCPNCGAEMSGGGEDD